MPSLSDDELARLFQVSARTVRNWRVKGFPVAVSLALELLGGNLSRIHPDWNGWEIARDGRLCSPDGYMVTMSQVRHMNMAFNERDLLKGDKRRLEQRLAELEAVLPRAQVIPFPVRGSGTVVNTD